MRYPPFMTMFGVLVLVSAAFGIGHSYHSREGLGTYPEVAPFTAAPTMIRAGDSATLSWASRGAVSVILESIPEGRPEAVEEVRGLPPTGSITVRPRESTKYFMRCETVSSTRMCDSEARIEVKPGPKVVPLINESGFGSL